MDRSEARRYGYERGYAEGLIKGHELALRAVVKHGRKLSKAHGVTMGVSKSLVEFAAWCELLKPPTR